MIRVIGSVLALVAALVAVGLAALAETFLCGENCSNPGWELSAQLLIAVAGLGVTAVMAYFLIDDRDAEAKALFVAALVVFAVWAVVLDAATHGWGSGPVPF